MIRSVLNLLLALVFLASGFANANGHPARMDRAPCEHASVVLDHAAMEHSGHQGGHATPNTLADEEVPVPAGDCCGEAICNCGCALPSVAFGLVMSITLQGTSSAPVVALVAAAVSPRSTAPFRPPSV